MTHQLNTSAAHALFGIADESRMDPETLLGEYADSHDLDAIREEYLAALEACLPDGVTLYGTGLKSETADPDFTGVQEKVENIDFWGIAARHQITPPTVVEEDPADEEDVDEDPSFHQAIKEGAHRQYGDHPAHIEGGIKIFVNTEFKSGGLEKWPTSPHFWVKFVAPDGVEEVFDTTVGSWGQLSFKIEDSIQALEDRRKVLAKRLTQAAEGVTAAEVALDEARTVRADAIVALSRAGVTNYRIAKIAGVTQTTVATILKDHRQQ